MITFGAAVYPAPKFVNLMPPGGMDPPVSPVNDSLAFRLSGWEIVTFGGDAASYPAPPRPEGMANFVTLPFRISATAPAVSKPVCASTTGWPMLIRPAAVASVGALISTVEARKMMFLLDVDNETGESMAMLDPGDVRLKSRPAVMSCPAKTVAVLGSPALASAYRADWSDTGNSPEMSSERPLRYSFVTGSKSEPVINRPDIVDW